MIKLIFSQFRNILINLVLQIQLPEEVSRALSQLLEIPFIFRLVTGLSVVGIGLFSFSQYLKHIHSILQTSQKIRASLKGETSTVSALSIKRNELLKASKNIIELRKFDAFSVVVPIRLAKINY